MKAAIDLNFTESCPLESIAEAILKFDTIFRTYKIKLYKSKRSNPLIDLDLLAQVF